jgi:hypothetical protein
MSRIETDKGTFAEVGGFPGDEASDAPTVAQAVTDPPEVMTIDGPSPQEQIEARENALNLGGEHVDVKPVAERDHAYDHKWLQLSDSPPTYAMAIPQLGAMVRCESGNGAGLCFVPGVRVQEVKKRYCRLEADR